MDAFIEKLLKAPWQHYSSITSTNDFLMSLSDTEIADGQTCTADEQTGGHGQRQRTWSSPPGGLYMSILLVPNFKPSQWHQIGFVMGVAAAKSVAQLCPEVKPQLKWPNDILVNYCKIGGILLQSKNGIVSRVVVGLGINVSTHPQLLPQNPLFPACSLNQISPHPVSIRLLAETIRFHFFNLYSQWKYDAGFIFKCWNNISALKDKPLKLIVNNSELTGICQGINSNGNLILKQGDSFMDLHNGDVISFEGVDQ